MTITLAQVVSLAVGTVLPLLAGLAVRIDAHPRVRSIVLLVLAAATSFLTELGNALAAHQPFNVGSALLSVLVTFVAAAATQFGLWEPTGAAAVVKAIGGFIGGSKPAPATPAPALKLAGSTYSPSGGPTEPVTPPSGPAGTSPPIPPA